MRLLRSITGILRETRAIAAIANDTASTLRYAASLLLVKLGRRSQLRDGLRKLHLRGGITIHYRLNRGDLQSIREVWVDEEYKLPSEAAGRDVLVDLGANIGMTSLWLAKQYNYRTVVAVEPSFENAELTRINLSQNGINAIVIEAAAGPENGTVSFATSVDSNMGHIDHDSSRGISVRQLSMDSILKEGGVSGEIDLLKMDIEGGEESLVRGNLQWLSRVRLIIAELHPKIVDTTKVIAAIESTGLRFYSGRDHRNMCLMDHFRR